MRNPGAFETMLGRPKQKKEKTMAKHHRLFIVVQGRVPIGHLAHLTTKPQLILFLYLFGGMLLKISQKASNFMKNIIYKSDIL